MPNNAYDVITNAIVAMIENGAGEWRMPWHSNGSNDALLELPRNPVSGTRYRGINVPLLWGSAKHNNFSSHLWATYKQWSQIGAQVKRGEKATTIVFWKQLVSRDESDSSDESKNRVSMMAKAYAVFNASQVDNYSAPITESPVIEPCTNERVPEIDAYFAAIGVNVRHGGNRAFYSPAADFIAMPEFSQFNSAADYYSTLGHEHVHYTGHKKRCNREFGKRFGDNAYAFEELCAELGAAFLCAELGISNEPRPDHAAYLDSWLRVLKSDTRAIFTAASKAQAAIDWLNNAANAKAEKLAA